MSVLYTFVVPSLTYCNLFVYIKQMADDFTVEVHHLGHFIKDPLLYVGGFVNHVDNLEQDKWSKLEVEDIVERLGYTKYKMLWYIIPGLGLEEGLRVIGTDKDAMDMATYVKGHEQIEVYVEHVIEQADESINVSLALPLPKVGMDEGAKGNPEVELEDISIEEDNDHGGIGHEKVYYNSDTDDSVLDMDYPLTDDNDYDDVLFVKYTEKEDVIIEEMGNDLFGSDIEREDNNEKTNNYDLNVEGMRAEYDSEELISGEDSESEHENEDNQPHDNETFNLSKFESFKPVERAENLRFCTGMLFTSLQQFKMAITEYAVHGGYAIKFQKNDKTRVRAVCEDECPFKALCAEVPRQMTFQLKTLVMEHECIRTYKNVRCSSRYKANQNTRKGA